MYHPMSRVLALTILLSILASTSYSQFGVTGRYVSNSYETYGETNDWFDSNIEIGANYWFRLKNRRIEFLPEVYYGLSDEASLRWPSGAETISKSYIGVEFNTQIYVFDLANDCDCPTFSKQGPELQKSFYLSIAPGVQLKTTEAMAELGGTTETNSQLSPNVGVGAGFDVGINNLLTISPYGSYRFHLQDEEIISDIDGTVFTDGLSSLQFGLRLIFRPDYVKQYGRR